MPSDAPSVGEMFGRLDVRLEHLERLFEQQRKDLHHLDEMIRIGNGEPSIRHRVSDLEVSARQVASVLPGIREAIQYVKDEKSRQREDREKRAKWTDRFWVKVFDFTFKAALIAFAGYVGWERLFA